jgi:AcrR family transcriptional regulator
VARAQLERVGYEATSIRSVAGEAGVAAGTVLLHFRDKLDLLHAALFDELTRTWAQARLAAQPAQRTRARPLEEDLTALARAFFDYYAARPALSRALLRESLFAAPPWSARFAAQVAEVHGHVVALAAAAEARGELGPGLDGPLLGAAFFSFYYFALLAWLQGGHPDPARLFRRLLAQHLRGLRAGGGAAARATTKRNGRRKR